MGYRRANPLQNRSAVIFRIAPSPHQTGRDVYSQIQFAVPDSNCCVQFDVIQKDVVLPAHVFPGLIIFQPTPL